MVFPLSPNPSGMPRVEGSTRGNIYYPGETPTFNWLEGAFTGTYEVRDYFGTIILTGGFTSASNLALPTPVGGWQLGWYRLYLRKTGASDALFGDSFGCANFCFVTDDARFVRPAGHTTDSCPGGEFPDLALKGFLGIGTSRIQITNAADPATVNGGDDISPTGAPVSFAISNTYWTTGVDHRGNDAARPRYSYISFPNQATDRLTIGTRLLVEFKSGAAAAAGSVSVVIAAGTSSGIKLTFTQGATVETWDNVTATVTAVLAQQLATPSNLVRVYRLNDQSTSGAVTTGSGTLSNAKYLGVKLTVETCWPLGVEWYEGPDNEPDIRKNPVRYANDSFMFREAVKAGNASAKVKGPAMIDITTQPVGPSEATLGINAFYKYLMGYGNTKGADAAQTAVTDGPVVVGKDQLDAIDTHVYSMGEGEIDKARRQLDAWVAMLNLAGVGSLDRWQGELGYMSAVYAIYRPRHSARLQMMTHLLLEQYGIPKERNNMWYDASHGFWSFPAFWRHGAQSVAPQALMLRVMAEEVFGKVFEQRLDFGTGIGEHLFVGNSYLSPTDGTRTVALICASHLTDQDVVLQLEGDVPATITWRDAQGRVDTLTVDGDERISVPTTSVPAWVRLPAGVTATVHTFLGLYDKNVPDIAARNAWASFDGNNGARQPVRDGYWIDVVPASERTFQPAPDELVVKLAGLTTVSDVIVMGNAPWQSNSGLVDFDVETSDNGGGSWTTRRTVVNTTATSFFYGSPSSDAGCTRESFWDEQWVYPVKFDDPVECNAIRIVVRQTSRGGEPDGAAESIGGQGWGSQQIVLSRVYVASDSLPTPAVIA